MASSSNEIKSDQGKATTFHPADRLTTFLEPTVWHIMTPLSQKSGALNLGQGFPGFSPPGFVKDSLVVAASEGNGLNYLANQYARSAGHLQLVKHLAESYSTRFQRKIDPETEIIICNGATGAIFNATQSILNPGDEVIAFEPAFDIYSAQAEMCGATLKRVPLRVVEDDKLKAKRWVFDLNEFASAFTSKTRLVILNTPHNPTGKVFTEAELTSIAEVVKKYPDVVVLSDEVYEHIVFDAESSTEGGDKPSPRRHLGFADLPGMYNRTLTVSSAGKTFSCTGWKVGWACGPSHLVRAMGIAGSWVSFSVNTPSQIAVALSFEKAKQPYDKSDTYFAWLKEDYTKKRTTLANALRAVNIEPIMPEGSFFIVADTSRIQVPQKWLDDYKHESRDWAFARWLTTEIGVACIPPSPFYSKENAVHAYNLARFSFAQSHEILDEAAKRLLKLKDHIITNSSS